MRAIRVNELGGPEVLEIEESPTPEPAPDQILVEIKAVGVNPVDTYIRTGYQGYDPVVPFTPGYDASGVVKAIGSEIHNLTIGTRVYLSGAITGTYADHALCEATQVHPIPDHTSYSEAASLFVAYVTAYRGLIQRAEARPGETVLIHGASGAVGIAAIQFAKNLGLSVIATASTEAGQKLVKDQGADLVLDHADASHFSQVSEYTDERGVNIILEMMAHKNLSEDLKILASKGRVVIIGNRDNIEINPRDTMACDGAILGMSLMNINEDDEREIHAAITAGLRNKTIAPFIRCELPLEEASKAHVKVMEPGALGKIILIP